MTDAIAPAEPPHDATRVRRAVAAWRKRSQMIRFWRRALPVTIGAVLLGMTGWVVWRGIATERQDLGDVQVVRLVNARFFGQDGQGRPFVLAAAEATRPLRGDTSRITLRGPVLELDQGGKVTRLTSRSGVYDEASLVVRLQGGVELTEPTNGFRLTTPEALADTRNDVVSGDKGVTAQGPLGRVDATSYAIYERGARIVFKGDGTLDGRVKSRIEQRRR